MILPLHEMTLEEKLQAMEALWEDLSRNAEALESPEWHKTALKERKKRLASGKTAYMDWDRAKKEMRRRVA
jgi:hypothetical protein